MDEQSNPFETAQAETTEEKKEPETTEKKVAEVSEAEPTAFEKQAAIVRKLSEEVTRIAKGRVETDISSHPNSPDKAYWDKKNELHLEHNKLEALRSQ